MIAEILYIAVLAVLAALIILILRQKGSSYFGSVQIVFNATFISFALIVSLDFVKNHLVKAQSPVFCIYSTKIGISAILLMAIATEYAALMFYRRKEDKNSWKMLFSKKLGLPLISISYKGYIAFVLIITWIFTPWQTKLVMDMWGEKVYTTVFEWWYIAFLSVVVVAFLAYPCTLLILSSRKYKEKEVARALKWFAVCMIGIAIGIIVFYGLLRSLGFEMVECDYLPSAFFFGIIAYFFKETTTLESLFEKMYAPTYAPRPTSLIKDKGAFSKALGLTHGQIAGKNILFEFDSISDYERVVEDFVDETLANSELITVFTSKGSAIYSALSNKGDVKFLILTQNISVPQANASKNEVLMPANNFSLLLDALDKTFKAYPEKKSSIVFDSLSSLVLLNGFEKTYSFLRYALEMVALENGTSLFLMDPVSHEAKIASTIRSLFNDQITYGKLGLQVVKMPKPALKT
jgi:hypothetical protein